MLKLLKNYLKTTLLMCTSYGRYTSLTLESNTVVLKLQDGSYASSSVSKSTKHTYI